jgi:hypothetical protein
MNTLICRLSNHSHLVAFVAMFFACVWSGHSATPIAGDVAGTWTTNGSPYVIALPSTVIAGGSLTIEPGVTVILGSDIRFTVEGKLTAVGTVNAPIIFRGTTPTAYWDSIMVNPGDGSTNSYVFQHCQFSDSRGWALWFTGRGRNRALVTSCKFSNCLGDGVFASVNDSPGGAELDISIRNCIFDSVRSGCIFATYGPNVTLNPSVSSCIFRDMRVSACSAVNVNVNVPTTIRFNNNTVLRSPTGIFTEDPNDTIVQNNIFTQNGVALKRYGSRSLTASYNCFFNNGTNFQGYPGVYGSIVTANHNGDPSDVFSNILLSPQFNSATDYRLSATSPCIDAGDPSIADVCFDISKGTGVSDIGAFGGPDACGWMETLFPPVELGIQAYAGLTITGGLGQVYCVEYRDGFQTNNPWTPLATNVMTNATWLFVDTTTPIHTRRFYRVRSKP